jgi:hypothetical protein
MPDSLVDLERRRANVQLQIAQLGDLRSGSLTGTGGRCGNGDPGYGPYYRLTRKVNGKTVTETLSSPASLAKAQREVAECQRFRAIKSWRSMNRSASCGPWNGPHHWLRKKNDRGDPAGDRTRSSQLWRILCNGRRKSGHLGSDCMWKPGSAAGAAPRRRWSWAMEPNGSGILPINTFRVRCRWSICITRANTCGTWRAGCIPLTKGTSKLG